MCDLSDSIGDGLHEHARCRRETGKDYTSRCTNKYKSVVVDRVGSIATLTRATRQLSRSHKPQRVLVVPGKSLNAAKKAMHEIGVSGTVRNMKDTHRIYVSTPASNSTKLKK